MIKDDERECHSDDEVASDNKKVCISEPPCSRFSVLEDAIQCIKPCGSVAQLHSTKQIAPRIPPSISSPEFSSAKYPAKIKTTKGGTLTHFRDPIQSMYVFKERIGVGSWGVVHRALERKTGYVRAIKRIEKKDGVNLARFRREMTILKGFDHPRVARVYETFEDYATLYIVMEYCEGGELFDRIAEEGPFPEPVAAYLMRQILSAVAYCHRKGLAHRDLKPDNFLFSLKDLRSPIKLVDFGLASKFKTDNQFTSVVGSICYLAPEVQNRHYDYRVDLWSTGMILYTLLIGHPCFSRSGNETDAEILRLVRQGDIDYGDSYISPAANDLIRSLCCKDPSRRIEAEEALNHAWLKMNSPSPLRHLPDSAKPIHSQFCCDIQALMGTRHSKKCCKVYEAEEQEDDNKSPFSWELRQLGLPNRADMKGLGERVIEKLRRFAQFSPLKKALLSLISQQLEQSSEMMYIRGIFDLLDVKGRGLMTVQEVCDSLMELTNEPALLPPFGFREMLSQLDSDGDGMIEYSDFAAACLEASTYLRPSAMQAVFRQLDNDGDDRVTPNQLSLILGWDQTELEKALLNEFEKNVTGDPMVHYDDVVAILRDDADRIASLYYPEDLEDLSIRQLATKDVLDFSDVNKHFLLGR